MSRWRYRMRCEGAVVASAKKAREGDGCDVDSGGSVERWAKKLSELLVLVHNRPRTWQQADMVVLKTLAEQMVIALNNAGLRRLVKNLSVTDEKSGLLKRASYIDLLLAESKRAIQNASSLSVMLLQFGKSAAMIKEYGEAEVQAVMETSRAAFCREHSVE